MKCECGGHIGCTTCDSMESRIEWIKCSDRMPTDEKPVIVYGSQMSSHWPDITYAKWNSKRKYWIDCFSYGGDEMIRENEIDHWLELPLPQGLHE